MSFDSRSLARPLLLAAELAACAAVLSACGPILVGGAAATTAVVATDRRTTGIQLEDQNIAFKVESNMAQRFGDTARINAMSYQGKVLLTGDAPDETVRSQAAEIASKIENVRSVVNQVAVRPVATFSQRSNDTWISSKVRTALINTKGVPSRTIDITTDHGVVYLMGKVTATEGNYAAAAAANVGGVARVVKLFEIMTPEEAAALAASQKGGEASSSAPLTKPSDAPPAPPAAEAIPIK